MGFSIKEIRELLEDNKNLFDVAKRKEKESLENIKNENLKLRQIQSFINELNGGNNMYNVIIKELPEVKVASIRKIISGYDELFTLAPVIMGPEMQRLRCECAKPAYCFNIYHDGEYRERNIDVEMCESIVDLKKDTDVLKFKIINKVDAAACILHKGPYSKLRNSYAYIFDWIDKNGYKVIDKPRESYIDGIWNKDIEDEWLTEIQIPIVKA